LINFAYEAVPPCTYELYPQSKKKSLSKHMLACLITQTAERTGSACLGGRQHATYCSNTCKFLWI